MNNNKNFSQFDERIPTLTIIVPCYNEEEAFPICMHKLIKIIERLMAEGKIKSDSCLLFIDDGSTDNTWRNIEKACNENPTVRAIKLSKNQGHQIALLAGLSSVETDINISIDVDLQDDINCIDKMIDKYFEGYEIVYGVRENRNKDTFFKRNTANLFYFLMSKLGVNQIANHADFRLMGKTATDSLKKFKEQNLYLRGLIPLLGYKTTQIYYERDKRIAGDSKYPLKKMVSLALEGITSFSVTPLRIATLTGICICFFSFLCALYAIIEKILGNTITGWSSIFIAVLFLGGLQIFFLGIMGEYIGKIYMESKQRPRFFIEKKMNFNQKLGKVNKI